MLGPRTNFLGDFTARQVDNLVERITRYTRFVVFTKRTLVILIVLIVSAVIVIPILNQDKAGIRIAFSGIEQQSEALTPKMLNPQFRGFDEQNQPFTVTADYAIQKENDTIELANINADITLDGGKWLSLKALQGLMYLKQKMIVVTGNVNVFYDDGYEFTTDALTVDVAKKTMTSESVVRGQGPMGAIESTGFTASRETRSILFKGPVRLTIFAGAK